MTHMLSRYFLNHILSNEDKITVKPQGPYPGSARAGN